MSTVIWSICHTKNIKIVYCLSSVFIWSISILIVVVVVVIVIIIGVIATVVVMIIKILKFLPSTTKYKTIHGCTIVK